jgi:hypothetical protein
MVNELREPAIQWTPRDAKGIMDRAKEVQALAAQLASAKAAGLSPEDIERLTSEIVARSGSLLGECSSAVLRLIKPDN